MAGLPRKSRAAIRPVSAPFSPAMSRERPGAGARRRVDSGPAHNKMLESCRPRRRHISFRHSACVGRIVTSHLLPAYARANLAFERGDGAWLIATDGERRSEEHTSELQSQSKLVCSLLLEKKKHITIFLYAIRTLKSNTYLHK